jgi:hypothetical protein
LATIGRLQALLRPDGRIVLVLRDHSRQAPDWLPNPLSRRPDEAQGVIQLFEQSGFSAHLVHRRRMVGIVADKQSKRSSN